MSTLYSDELQVNSVSSDLAGNSLGMALSSYGLELGQTGTNSITSDGMDSTLVEESATRLERNSFRESDLLLDNLSGSVLSSSTPIGPTLFSSGAISPDSADTSEQLALGADELTGVEASEDLTAHLTNALSSTDIVQGSLDYSDYFNSTRLYAFKDDYLIQFQNTESVSIDLESSIFDAYLQLVDANNGSVLDFDDDSGAGTNAQLSFTAQAGREYLIRATSYSSYETGNYSLTTHIGTNNPSPPTEDPINRFDSAYGYGIVDAATAVANSIGQSRFGEVADIGGDQWNNDMINAPEAWAQGYTGQGITVAVIDSGVDIFHEDLANNIWENTGDTIGDGIDNDGNGYIDDQYGWNFGRNNYDVRPGTDDPGQVHGTHVAGTIAAASNAVGMTGVAHGASIMALRLGDIVTDPVTGDGNFVNSGDLAEAIYYAVDNGADIINLSLGGGDPTGSVADALAYATSRDVIAVMASGNDEQLSPDVPASYATDYGISVGAVDINQNITDFSNQAGSDSRMQHVMAPGQDIFSTTPDSDYDDLNGTSMAAPHVAGVVALMLSANPNLTHAQVREILTGTAVSRSAIASSSIVLTQSVELSTATTYTEYSTGPLEGADYLIAYQENLAERHFRPGQTFSSLNAKDSQLEIASGSLTLIDQSAEGELSLREAATVAVENMSLAAELSRADTLYSDDWDSDDWQLPLQPSLFDDLPLLNDLVTSALV